MRRQGKISRLRSTMPHHCLPHTFACLRVAAAAISLTFAFVALAPPAVLGQDAPAEEAAPDAAPTEQAAPEQAAPEEGAAPEEAAPEEAAPEAPAAEETKSWDVAKPCENVRHPYQGDLCQQWRTAEAAEKTAAASKRTATLARLLMLIGAVATVLLLLMFIPLFMAAFGARRAARNAGLGGGGSSSAPLADRDREEELRAYLDVDKLEFIETPESEGIVKVKVAFRNTGQTPAFKIRSTTEIGIRDVADEDLVPTMPLPDRAKSATRARLGRDATIVQITECPSTPSLADGVMNGDATIVVWGFVEYMDMFDRKRRTNFQYLCNADTLDTGQIFKPMVRGDEEA
jgi:hypothetical protein